MKLVYQWPQDYHADENKGTSIHRKFEVIIYEIVLARKKILVHSS